MRHGDTAGVLSGYFHWPDQTSQAFASRLEKCQFARCDALRTVYHFGVAPSNRRLQKGMLKVRLSCSGVACHSGYPLLGKSAIDPLIEVLHTLKHRVWPSSEELGETTLNIGLIEGGQAANALAEAGEAVAMFRLIGAPEEVLDVVNAVAKEHGCSVEVGPVFTFTCGNKPRCLYTVFFFVKGRGVFLLP